MDDKLKLYQKGFNHGYILQKHAPELAEKIAKYPNPENEYFSGRMAGQQEHKVEKKQEQTKKPQKPQKDMEKER
jgi:hypothetical protein